MAFGWSPRTRHTCVSPFATAICLEPPTAINSPSACTCPGAEIMLAASLHSVHENERQILFEHLDRLQSDDLLLLDRGATQPAGWWPCSTNEISLSVCAPTAAALLPYGASCALAVTRPSSRSPLQPALTRATMSVRLPRRPFG